MAGVLDSHFLAITAIITVVYQFIFFIITAIAKFDKITDFAGSTNFVILAILTLCIKGLWHFRQVLITLFVVIWGLRLGLFLLMRILQWGEDRRFDEMRSNIGKLAVFWIFQAVWVWTVSLPVTVVNASNNNPGFRAQDIIGWIMWLAGIIIEATADQQKLKFKNSGENRGKWCSVGLWEFSRHPNYFGEIFLWWGIFIASTPVFQGAEWLVVIGPIFLTLLLLFVSGIPLLEDSSDKRFGSLPEYQLYKKVTRWISPLEFLQALYDSGGGNQKYEKLTWELYCSPLIPLSPTVYGKLPPWVKEYFLFELPMYSRNLPADGRSNWYD